MKISLGPQGATIEQLGTPLPSNKEDLERFFAERFVTAFNRDHPMPGVEIKNLQQQDTSDLDFRIDCARAKYLELAELTPLSTVFGRKALGNGRLGTLEYATWIYENVIRAKFTKYGDDVSSSTILLLYPTHGQFRASDSLVECLRSICFWRSSKFAAVYLFMTGGGPPGSSPELLYTITPASSASFPPHPEAFKGHWFVNGDHLLRPMPDGSVGFMVNFEEMASDADVPKD
jgi:hypothetical protein